MTDVIKSAAFTVITCLRCHHALHSVMLVSDKDDKQYITLTCGHCTNQMQFEVILMQSVQGA